MKVGKPQETKLIAADNRPVIPSATQILCSSTGAVLNPETQVVYVCDYADSTVQFQPQEVSFLKQNVDLGKGIRLLGFKKRSKLKPVHNLTHSTFIYPDQTQYRGSITMFASLLDAMHQQKQVAWVSFYPRNGSTPRFAALLPQRQVTDESGTVIPSGMHLIPLPFRDEIRKITFSSSVAKELESTEVAMTQALEKVCLRWRAAAFDPNGFSCTKIVRVHQMLHAKALDIPLGEFKHDDDGLAPDYDRWNQRCASFAQDYLQLVPSISAKPVKTESKVEITLESIQQLETLGKLSSLTIDELKGFLRTINLKVSGTKSVLIQRVQEYLQSD
jgi:ATP-dependent DNA helicase 2 subunit 1